MFVNEHRGAGFAVADDVLRNAHEEEPLHGRQELPEVVYLPTEEPVHRADADCVVEMRQLTDGRIGLLTYTSRESLVECCGDAQPWVSIPNWRLELLQEETNADVVVFDAPLRAEQMRNADGGEF
ncbi:hypothetical protein EV193_102753 [Herbihabitans rhizosphaerae]|uniref:Type III secretion system (T3SS) SseB-like protein n=1 Tax=Herbihabitans rhizosphaerae TaxID=1872711 RepID=A0A4Q7L660_9PSEU|nr:SAV_915 family protein [Herbihabitans rhizosphaerae]RZS43772.1 hypothetical protein EV193_102753 [Herbihabitans rhizosphaerae]